MKNQQLFIEYILLIIISSISFYLVYNWYITSKISYINIFNNDKFQNEIENIALILYNLQGIYYYNITIPYDFDAMCLYNYTLLYNGNCNGIPYNFTFQGYLININGSYYLYSNITNSYYLLTNYKYLLLQGCYEHYIIYLINSTYCYGICNGNCNINLEGIGNNLYVELT